jgi:excisionase family DNA binding protein
MTGRRRPGQPKSTDRDRVEAQQEVCGERIYDVTEAARILDVDASTIRRHIQRGDISGFMLGKKLRIYQSDLADFMARRRREAHDEAKDKRLTREMEDRVSRYVADPIAASEWAQTTCRRCTKPFLILRQCCSIPGEYRWKGSCPRCDDPYDLDERDVKSLAATEQERIAGISQRTRRRKEECSADPELARTHAYAWCWSRRTNKGASRCHEYVLLKLDEERTEPRWKGTCEACGNQIDRARSACRSLADDAQRERLRERIRQELEEAARNAETARQTAHVQCVGWLCTEWIIAHSADRDGEERWLGVCPFCNAAYDKPRSTAVSLFDASQDILMDDIPF